MSFETINKKEFLEEINIKNLLKGIPHVVLNDSGILISSESPDLVSSISKKEIRTSNPSQGLLIEIQIQDEYLDMLESFLAHLWSSTFKYDVRNAEAEIVEILGNDFTRFFSGDLFRERTSLNVQVKKAFFLLKSHIPIQEFALFFIDRKKGLKEFARIGGPEDVHKVLPLDGSNLESIAALSKNFYFAPNCKEEYVFKNQPNLDYSNYLCLPIFQDGLVVGVLSLIDYLEKDWSQENFKKAKLFAQLLAWVKMKKEGNEIFHEEIIEERVPINYLSKKMIREINEEPPKNIDVHCMWVNIRGAKDIFKGIDNEVIKDFYNMYYSTVFEICERYEGQVDNSLGDTISVVWNAFGKGPLSKNLVIECALEIQKEIFVTLIPFLKEKGIKRMGVGIGVDEGEAYVGNFGSSEEVNYSSFGFCKKNAEILSKIATPGEILFPESFFNGVDKEDWPGVKKVISGVGLCGGRQSEKIFSVQPVETKDYTKIKSY